MMENGYVMENIREYDVSSLPYTFTNGDTAVLDEFMIRVDLAGRRKVLSTSAYNGGIRDDIECVYNYDSSHGQMIWSEMLAPTLEGHMRRIGEDFRLPVHNTGLCTAAQMTNAAIVCDDYDSVTVTAMVTGGIDESGGRAGDPASWCEKNGVLGLRIGTINILLHIDCGLSEGAMETALLTLTEAKAAAIQELQLPSSMSSGIATGSGTDGVIIVCDSESDITLTDSGKHSKLGEMIGRTVFLAVKKALYLQSLASPLRLHDATRLLSRWGFTKDYVRRSLKMEYSDVDKLMARDDIWKPAVMIAHILDQRKWGVIDDETALWMASRFITIPKGKTDIIEAFASYCRKIMKNHNG